MMQCGVSPPPRNLNSPHTPLCCPVLLQGAGLTPMGAHGIGRMGVLTGGRQELLPRNSPRVGGAGGTPQAGTHVWGTPVQLMSVIGGPKQPHIISPTVKP